MTKSFESWTNRCIEYVGKNGLYECDNVLDEVIFMMEEDAERSLENWEKELVVKLVGSQS